jgi:hypothetical protein
MADPMERRGRFTSKRSRPYPPCSVLGPDSAGLLDNVSASNRPRELVRSAEPCEAPIAAGSYHFLLALRLPNMSGFAGECGSGPFALFRARRTCASSSSI